MKLITLILGGLVLLLNGLVLIAMLVRPEYVKDLLFLMVFLAVQLGRGCRCHSSWHSAV